MSADLELKLEELSKGGTYRKIGDSFWVENDHLDVKLMASELKELGARFTTMTGIALENDETSIIYHFAIGGLDINIKLQTKGNQMDSVTPLIPSANWIEREIHDLYAVNFVNHPNLDRLIRPEQLKEGLFREPGGQAGKLEREKAKNN